MIHRPHTCGCAGRLRATAPWRAATEDRLFVAVSGKCRVVCLRLRSPSTGSRALWTVVTVVNLFRRPLDPESGVGNSARIRTKLSLAPTPHAPGKAKHACHSPQHTQGEGQPQIRRRRARDPSGALRSAAPLDPESGVGNSANPKKNSHWEGSVTDTVTVS